MKESPFHDHGLGIRTKWAKMSISSLEGPLKPLFYVFALLLSIIFFHIFRGKTAMELTYDTTPRDKKPQVELKMWWTYLKIIK